MSHNYLWNQSLILHTQNSFSANASPPLEGKEIPPSSKHAIHIFKFTCSSWFLIGK